MKDFNTVKPQNGHKLVVVSWGPDSKLVTKALTEQKLECEQLILSYIHPANALFNYLKVLRLHGVSFAKFNVMSVNMMMMMMMMTFHI